MVWQTETSTCTFQILISDDEFLKPGAVPHQNWRGLCSASVPHLFPLHFILSLSPTSSHWKSVRRILFLHDSIILNIGLSLHCQCGVMWLVVEWFSQLSTLPVYKLSCTTTRMRIETLSCVVKEGVSPRVQHRDRPFKMFIFCIHFKTLTSRSPCFRPIYFL